MESIRAKFFPNIPRVADYFLKLDGRKCSNTTLLNSISEWEELYQEHQKIKFHALDEVLAPVFKKLEREISQVLQAQLDEKVGELEYDEKLRSDAINGQYLSLSHSLTSQDDALEKALEKSTNLEKQLHDLSNNLSYMKQRYEDTLSTLSIANENLSLCEHQLKESQLNLVQKEMDLVKLESKQSSLQQENELLQSQVQSLKNELDLLKSENSRLKDNSDLNIITILSAKIDSLNKEERSKE
ncbi:hypothetical protein O1D97_01905 [Marinomonas sp. 15G1-11]|uniref:Uncharacterized protein n=1 Tax=Marinomonas phaeophyticola TaxID=3004091 RepID=A0ABT4JPX4_9GAMM|nr:hypothetical protein [Marinomonas sp. 15G1-11]MCZ2720430.1 hypothetical protein [Marinomonas sp. 15G1-11]